MKWDFDQSGDVEGWTIPATLRGVVRDGALQVRPAGEPKGKPVPYRITGFTWLPAKFSSLDGLDRHVEVVHGAGGVAGCDVAAGEPAPAGCA